jgi:hypothetical protein
MINQPQLPAAKNNPIHGLANKKLTVIFTLTNVLYGTEKVQTENSQKRKNFMVANTIMAQSAIIAEGNYFL